MMKIGMGMSARSALLAVIAAASFLASGCAIAGTAVATVQSWLARSGVAPSSDDVLKVTEIGGVSVQPGGRLVSFTTLSADPACNCYHVKLNLSSTRTHDTRVVADLGQPFPAPMPDGSINGWPCVAESLWSSEGRYLAYIVNHKGHGVLFVYDSASKKSRSVLVGATEAFGFTWAASGDTIIFQTGGPQPTSMERMKQGKREGYLFGPDFAADPEGMPVIARVPEDSASKEDHADAIFAGDRAWADLRAVDVATGVMREASPREAAFTKTSAFSYSQGLHEDATEVRSSDGRFILGLGNPEIDYSGRSITISRRADATSIRKTSAEVCPGQRAVRDAALAYWDANANRFVIICTHSAGGWAHSVVSLNPVNALAQPLFNFGVMGPEGELGRQCDMASGEVVCAQEHPSEPPALFSFDLAHHTSVELYDPNGGLRRRQFPRIDRLVWNNSAGLPTRADLVYPYVYASHTRYPLVITQYSDGGFLRGNTGDENPIFAYARSGFFVLSFAQTEPAPEKPGLSFIERTNREWRGNKWRKSIQNSLDIVIRSLIDRGFVDPSRIAYTGLSGGSNQIDFALANGRRMAAVITSTCCMDPHAWVTDPLNPDFYKGLDVENPVLDKSRSRWSLISPVLHVDGIHAAILVNASEHERFGFRALWSLMQYAHKPMETYVYAGEYHVKFQPEHLAAIQHRNVDWLRFWLQGYEDPDPAKAERYARWRRMRQDWCTHDPKCVRVP